MSGASSMSIPKPYALARNSRGSGPIVVPETSTSSPPSGVTRTSTMFM